MTKDEIIRMAREAGFYGGELSSAEESFVHFAALVAAAELRKKAEHERDSGRRRIAELAAHLLREKNN